jgi:hypothetical protein
MRIIIRQAATAAQTLCVSCGPDGVPRIPPFRHQAAARRSFRRCPAASAQHPARRLTLGTIRPLRRLADPPRRHRRRRARHPARRAKRRRRAKSPLPFHQNRHLPRHQNRHLPLRRNLLRLHPPKKSQRPNLNQRRCQNQTRPRRLRLNPRRAPRRRRPPNPLLRLNPRRPPNPRRPLNRPPRPNLRRALNPRFGSSRH